MVFDSLNIQWYVINCFIFFFIFICVYIWEIKYLRFVVDVDGFIWVISDYEFFIVSENFLFRNSNGEFYFQGYISIIDFSYIDVMYFNNLIFIIKSICF